MEKSGIKTWCPKCFKALSTRVGSRIINILADGQEHGAGEIVSHFKLTQPTISYHLQKLADSGILKSRTQGRQVLYGLNKECPYDSKKCILK